MVSSVTAVFAVIVVILMVLPSITQAETTRSVDVGDLESLGSITFSFSTFQYATISISNISHNGSTAISITDPDDDYALHLSKDDAGYVHFGNIDANMSANLVILNLEVNSTYKLRMLVNDGMGITFTYLNASSYQLPQTVNLYGYTFPAGQGSDHIDLGIVNGTAHRVTLSSSTTLEYSKYYYNATEITNATITGSKSIYLSNQTTKLKLEMPSSQLFHLKLNVATPYPSSSGEGSYYDGDAIIVPVSDPETYNQIVNQWNEGAPTRETINVTTEQVITGYEIGEDNMGRYVVSWYIQKERGPRIKARPDHTCKYGPDTTDFRIYCSLENLCFIGDFLPTVDHVAYFDWVAHCTPDPNACYAPVFPGKRWWWCTPMIAWLHIVAIVYKGLCLIRRFVQYLVTHIPLPGRMHPGDDWVLWQNFYCDNKRIQFRKAKCYEGNSNPCIEL